MQTLYMPTLSDLTIANFGRSGIPVKGSDLRKCPGVRAEGWWGFELNGHRGQ